jgi:Flp pilus assembly protein TadG
MRMIRTLTRSNGQATVEFALIVPLLVLIIAMIVQVSKVWNNYIRVTDGTRAGARKGAVTKSASSCVQAVKDSSGLTFPTAPTCTSTWASGSQVTVTATYPYSISWLGVTIKSGNLSSTTTERVE